MGLVRAGMEILRSGLTASQTTATGHPPTVRSSLLLPHKHWSDFPAIYRQQIYSGIWTLHILS